jgi:hypothetical protein
MVGVPTGPTVKEEEEAITREKLPGNKYIFA